MMVQKSSVMGVTHWPPTQGDSNPSDTTEMANPDCALANGCVINDAAGNSNGFKNKVKIGHTNAQTYCPCHLIHIGRGSMHSIVTKSQITWRILY